MTTPHHCHAHDCQRVILPRLFMCRKHWFSLPVKLRDAVQSEYRRGQEIDKRPTARYMAVQQYAVCRTAFKKFDEAASLVCAEYLTRAIMWQRRAIEAGDGDPLKGLIPEEKKKDQAQGELF